MVLVYEVIPLALRAKPFIKTVLLHVLYAPLFPFAVILAAVCDDTGYATVAAVVIFTILLLLLLLCCCCFCCCCCCCYYSNCCC